LLLLSPLAFLTTFVDTTMAKTVLILGGSLAGLHIAHALLKKNDKDVKVILVSQVRTPLNKQIRPDSSH